MLSIHQKHNLAKLALSVLLAFWGVSVWGSSVTIGSEGSTSMDTYLPMNSLYDYSYSQQIYTAEEIGMSGFINSITIWLKGGENLHEMKFDIYMVETDKEAFENNTDWIPVTNDDIVYSGTVTVHNTVAEAYTFTLDKTFEYSGEGNLVICFNNKTGLWKGGLAGRVFNGEGEANRSIYTSQDETALDPTAPNFGAKSITKLRNVITLDITHSGVAIPKMLTVSDITAHTAKLLWTGGTGLYILDYKKASDAEWTNMLWNTTLNTYTLENLESNTEYSVRVQSVGMHYATSGYRTATFTTETAVKTPTNITVTHENNTGDKATALLQWTQSDGADQWECSLNDNLAGMTNRTYKRFTNLTPETEYSFKVRAYNSELQEYSDWSDEYVFYPSKKRVIGEGTSSSEYVPTHTYYKYSLTEQIYTAEELGQATAIESIALFSKGQSTRSLDIYMVSTDKSRFEDGDDWVDVSDDNLVFSGNVTFNAGEWNTIDLDDVYVHDGQSNMLLVVNDKTGDYDESSNSFYAYACDNQALYAYSDYTVFDPSKASDFAGYRSSLKNQIRLGTTDVPTCQKPQNVTITDIGSHYATISWTSEAGAWQVCLNDNEEFLLDVEDEPTLTYNGLMPETTYTIKVRTNCGNGDVSRWSKPVTFTTDIPFPAPKELAVNDIKQNSAVISWETNQETVSSDMEYAVIPKTANSVGNDGDWYYYDNDTYGSSIGLGGGAFWWGVMFPAGSYYGPTLSAVSIYDDTAMTGTITIFNDGDTAPENEIGSKPLTLTGAKKYVEVSFDDLSIDESKNLWVVVYNESGAGYPAAICAEDTDDPNARWVSIDGINWQDLADSGFSSPWMIRAFIKDWDNLAWVAVPGVTSPHTLAGLKPDTRYYVRVKANYNGGESAWMRKAFTTLERIVPTGIVNVNESEGDHNWYSIDGKKLNGQPKAKGVYFRNGRKVVVK